MATKAEIISDERMRIVSILESPEGKARPQSALKFALYSDMTPDMAKDFLKGLPVESAFAAAMEREGPVNIGAPLGGPVSRDTKEARKAEIAKVATDYSLVRGYITSEQAAARGLKGER